VASEPVRISEPIKFGEDFELDVRAYELRRSGKALKLERIPMELLVLLVEQRGQLVTRDHIVERIWGRDVFLDTDNSINAAIRKIRQVLKDDPEHPRFVLTVTGKGYRFVAPIEEVSAAPPPPGVSPPVPSGESILGKRISHYRIVQMLGGGGMGVVYKAEDLKLGRPVALKFLPSELASDPVAFERLQREARAASSLDHPNICSIYQLGEHDGQPFIVMQLLEGQTLREWIESAAGKPTPERVRGTIELTIQIADGLEAAHQKGIIHRDIKPTNIFITSRGRAKILDFGVAKFVDAAEMVEPNAASASEGSIAGAANPHLTRTGASVGTPSYLSPEQIRRENIDGRSDLFSLGLVLYEMATGQRTFSGNTATVIRNAVLNLPVAPVRHLDPQLPSGLERVINKSLEKDPSRRYQTAGELRDDLMKLRETRSASVWRPSRIAAALAIALFVLAAVLLLANVGGIRDRLLPRQTPEAPVQVKPRPSVAVLGFKNLSGKEDEAWISTALSEMLGAELAAGQQLRIVPGENVARMKLDLSLVPANSYGQDTLTKIRNQLNTDMVVLGSYLALGKEAAGKVRVELQLQDTKSGETLSAISQDGTEAELAELVSRSGANLRQKLGLGDISAGEARQVLASVPTNLEAARLYSKGLARLEKLDALAARDPLQKAIAADPNHALSHSALAQAWSALGYDAKAAEEAKRALDLSTNLPREQRLAIEGNYHEFSRDLPAAIEIYRTLSNFFPDSLEYGLHLAALQTKKNLGSDALQTIARMRSLPKPAGDDPRIDHIEARAASSLGNFNLALKSAQRAATKARVQDARMLLAEALWSEGFQWDRLGDFTNAEKQLTEARDLAAASGNPLVLAGILRHLGIVAYDRGDFAAARKPIEESLAILHRIGGRRQESQASVTFGNILYEQGKLEEAKRYYDDALRIDREIAAPPSAIGSDLGSIANVLDGMGNLPEATSMQEQSLQAFHEAGDKRGECDTLGNIANVLVERGELELASQRYDQAAAMAQEIGYKDGYSAFLMSSTDVYLAQDQLKKARELAQQSLALRQEIGAAIGVAESQFDLAEIAFEQGQLTESERLLRAAAPKFDEQNKSDLGAQTAALLTRVLLAQSKLPESKISDDRASALAHQTSDLNSHFAAAIASALVMAAEGRVPDAIRGLETVRLDASRRGFVWWDFESRLHLGEIELRSGKLVVARVRLQQLQSDAHQKGFLLIARKAATALGQFLH
jgi:serine/threonine protein kinase/tetratricopeptide (TPR) repeat protein